MLKVGLIGCGFMGTMHANCYRALPGVELAAVADVRRECAEELARGTEAVIYADGMDLIREADVDVIDICLPTYLHAKYALAAMERVGYVFIEKPVSLTVEESRELIEKQKKTGCRVQVGQVIRFWDEYVALREIIKDGRLGRVKSANFRRLSPSPDWGWNNWLHDVAFSGGAAQDLHVHDVDYVLSVFGAPKKIYSLKNRIGEENSYINTLMEYDGFPVSVEGTWDLPASFPFTASFRVVFEGGVVELGGGSFTLYTDAGREEIKIEKKELALSGGPSGNISDLGGYSNELLYFTERAAAGEPIAMATLESASASLAFLLLDEIAFGK